MKRVFAFLILCVVLAVVRVLLMALVIVLLLALVHAFLTRPRETLTFLGTFALTCLAVAQPIACIVGVVVIAIVAALVGRRQRRGPQHVHQTSGTKGIRLWSS